MQRKHTSTLSWFVMVAAALLLTSCGQDPDAVVGDSHAETDAPTDTGSVDISASIDAGPEPDTTVAVDVGAEPSCPGGSGCPCTANKNCDSTLCIEGPDGRLCAQSCVDSCAKGFACAQLSRGSDLAVVCVSNWSRLCSPCEQTKDCNHAGVTGARCIASGAAGNFCGSGCATDGDCPSSYACKDTKDVDGTATKQCLPIDTAGKLASCTCSKNSVALALKTTCSKSIAEGGKELTCAGQALCTVVGDAPVCMAPAPEQEKCDGLDNDCDGDTDEGSCDDENVCTIDACDSKKDGKGCSHAPANDGAACDADGSLCTVGDACKVGKCEAGPVKNCDDKNPCTKDSCDLATGCTQVADDGAPCDDENPCTIGDVCADRKCKVGEPKVCASTKPCVSAECDLTKGGKCGYKNKKSGVTCNDGDPCTKDDGCEDGGCEGTKVECDDKNPCTDDSCDAKKGCIYTANFAPCEDGDTCTLLDKCADASCKAGAPKKCDDGQSCTVDTCDKMKGACVFSALPKEGSSCDADGSVCTVTDVCKAGKCSAGKAKNCDDGNGCTTDSCGAKLGCLHAANTESCSDGDGCSLADQCKGKSCVAGKAKTCDDKEFCTVDTCEKKTGNCVFSGLPKQATPCDADGSVCTAGDACDGGKCKAGGEKKCDDGNGCTDDACDAKSGCKATINSLKCDDSDACTSGDVCVGGGCSGSKVTCDDKNPCTKDSCDAVTGCAQVADDGAPCDDENPCTLGDVCSDKKCKVGEPKVCTSTKPCVSAECDQTESGKCGFKNKKLGTTCNDGDACTKDDGCEDGGCVGTKVQCDDKNLCTDDSCDAKKGCVYKENVAPCEDGNKCTLLDKCAAGSCKTGTAKKCDDGQSCTVDTCDKTKGACVFSAAPKEDSSCDADGSVCSVSDVCKAGKCAAGSAKNCDDGNGCTTDGCDAKLGCKHVANTESCSDGNGCSLADQCKDTACIAGKSKVCDDKELCTVDSCDKKTGNCEFIGLPKQSTPCDADGSVCTVGDSCDGGKCKAGSKKTCDDGNGCTDDACDAKSGCKSSNNNLKCTDDDACTSNDACAGGVCGGSKVTCDDKNPCTVDTCDKKSGCKAANVDDQTTCSGDGKSWCVAGNCVVKTGVGKSCTAGNQCSSGFCVDGVCCDGACTKGCLSCLGKYTGAADGLCKPSKAGTDPDNECKTMDVSTCGFTGMCDGAGQCAQYPAGKICQAASCLGGTHVGAAVCAANGCVAGKKTACDDKNGCTEDVCDVAQVCVHKETGKACDDGSACTNNDLCSQPGGTNAYSGAAPDGFGQCVGKTVDCDDGNPCTKDACDPTKGCVASQLADTTSCGQAGVHWCVAGECVGVKQCMALQFNKGLDGVVLKDGLFDGMPQGTVEAWFRAKTLGSGVFSVQEHHFALVVGSDGRMRFHRHHPGIEIEAISNAGLVKVGQWHHAAGVWGPAGMKLFLDGKLVATNAHTDGIKFDAKTAKSAKIGTEDSIQYQPAQSFDGLVYSVRVASVPRYEKPFTAGNLELDKNTIGLWRMDVGHGATVFDLSDTSGPGTIEGAKWIAACPPHVALSGKSGACGDGVVNQLTERCDDGNTKDGDGCNKTCQYEVALNCSKLHAKMPQAPSGTYVMDPDGAGPGVPFSAHCDMITDGGGWMWLGYGAKGTTSFSAWLNNGALNPSGIGKTSSSWHLSSAQINSLGASAQYRGGCSSQTNNHYWKGGGTWSWTARTPTTKCTANFDGTGSSYATVWQDSCHWSVIAVGDFVGAHCNNGNSAVVNPWYCGKSHATNISLWGRPK